MPEAIGKGVLQVGFDAAQVRQAGQSELLPTANEIARSVGGVFAAVKIAGFAKDGIDELKAAAAVSAQTNVLLKNLGGAAGVTADQVDGLAESMLKQSGVDDEVAKSAENTLLRLGILGDTFKEATPLANDLGIAMGGNMASGADLLGKALARPEQAARLLKPAIGALSDEQAKSIAAFVQQGDAAAAQNVILDAVRDKVGGTAAAYGDTLAGKLDIAKESMANMKGELTAGMAPALELGAELTTKMVGAFDALPEPLQAAIGTTALVGGGIAALARPVNDVVTLFGKWRDAHAAATIAVEAETVANSELAISEDAVAASTGAASAGIGAILGPAGLALGAVAALETVVSLFSDTEQSAAVIAADYTQALKEQGAAADEDADKVTAHALAQDEAAQKAHDAGLSYKDMFDVVRQGGVDFGELERQVADSGNTLEEALRNGGAESSEFGRQLLFLADHGKLTRETALDLLNTLEGLHNKYDDTKAATEAESEALGIGAAAFDENTGSVDDNAAAVDQATKALQVYEDQLHAATDPLFAMLNASEQNTRANEDLDRAQQDVTDAIAKYGAGSREAADAQRGLNDAQTTAAKSALDLNAAAAQLEAQIQNGTVSVAAAQNQLGQWVAQGLITQATADGIGARFDYVAATANNLQGKNIAMTMNLDDAGVLAHLHEIGQLVQTLTDGTKTIEVDVASRNVTHRALGGPVGPGQMFQGAEHGFELLMRNGLYQAPPGGGYVLNHQQSEAYLQDLQMAGGAPTGSPAIVFDPRLVVEIDGYAVATAVRNHDRRLR